MCSLPSYQYTKDIKPEDLQPDKPPELDKKQKAANWWRYHWGWVAGGLAVVVLAAFFIRDTLSAPVPDVTVGVISPYALPDEATSALADALAQVWGDVNGNGEALVQVDVYTIDTSTPEGYDESGNPIMSESDADSQAGDSSMSDNFNYQDPYAQMSGVVRLSGAFEGGDVIIFLAEGQQAQAYQDAYGVYGNAEGDPAGNDVYELTVAFSELGVLQGMDITYTDPWTGEEVDVAELLGDFRVGLRTYTGTKLARMDDGRALFEAGRAQLEQLK